MVLPRVDDVSENRAYEVALSYPPKLMELPQKAQEEERLYSSMDAAEEAVLVSGQTQADLWGKASIYTDMENGYAVLHMGNVRITIDPAGDAGLPEQARDCHCYVTGTPNGRGGEISSQYTVFSVSEETANQGIIRYTPEIGEVFVTAGQGNLVLEQDFSGTVSIRRE